MSLNRQRVKDCFLQQWHSDIENSPKALYYKHFKFILEVESYLKIDLPFLYRIILAKFRCSGHCLMIEKGRHQDVDRSLRFCQICLQRNAYVVEDEFHFFCVCPAYEEIRNIYFKPQWIRGILTVDKFYSIMSSPEKSSILSICKFLLSAISYRQELLLQFESSHN